MNAHQLAKQQSISSFIRVRRHARDAKAILDNLVLFKRVTNRQLKLAKAKVAAGHLRPEVEVDIRDHNNDIRRRIADIRSKQVEMGEILFSIFEHLDMFLTLDERCDLLNINPAHRNWEGETNPTTLDLVMLYGLEDSADKHDPEVMDGALWACLHSDMWSFFKTDPRGRTALQFMLEAMPDAEIDTAPAGTTLH